MNEIKKVTYENGNWLFKYDLEAMKSGEPMTLEDAEHSVYDVEKVLRPYVDEWGRVGEAQLINACALLQRDSYIRKTGKQMQSRYPGKTIFREEVKPGDEIIYSPAGIVLVTPTHKGWAKYLK